MKKYNSIRKVEYGSDDYYLGVNYILHKHPNNSHLLVCYTGASFRNLARNIEFDRTGKSLAMNAYLSRPQRSVIISPLGEVVAVMVTVSFPEFYFEIEYEDYVLIAADTTELYKKLLDQIPFSNKMEIVTFNNKQVELVKTKFCVKKIHYWSVYKFQSICSEKNFLINAKIQLMNERDIKTTKKLSKGLREEESPYRFLLFQLSGLQYKNYVVSLEGKLVAYVGICSYNKKLSQIMYLKLTSKDKGIALKVMQKINLKFRSLGNNLIWRLNKEMTIKYEVLIKTSFFVKLLNEYHLHLV